MKSIRTKFLILMLACVLLSAIALVSVGILNVGALAGEDSVQIMNLLCAERAQEMDTMLLSVEQAVNTMQRYAETQLSGISDFNEDKIYTMLYMKKTKELAYNVAENTSGTTAVYVCLEPEYAVATDGFWLLRREGQETFEEGKTFNVADDASGEEEDISWYQSAVSQDAAMWNGPHENVTDDRMVISYVMPLHKGDTVIGVIGMDVDMDTLRDYVDSIQIYETGYAFLADAHKNLYYHKDYPDGLQAESVHGAMRKVMMLLGNDEGDYLYSYQWNDEEKKLTFRTLRNGMLLVITVPSREINATQTRFVGQSFLFLLIIIAFSAVLTIRVTKMITRPLKDLSQVAQKIAAGDLDVTIECTTKDEVGVLAESFRQTVRSLKQHIGYINKLAYTDAMTGAMNKMAYKEAVDAIEKQMENGTAEFAVVVMDINNLKKINDNFGHEFGDMLIRDSASIIQRTFQKNTIYRIGGDEFVTILKDADIPRREELLEIFTDEIRRFNRDNTKYEQKVQIAIGIAVYDRSLDKTFPTVFRRADSAMYENKVMLKEKEKQEA